MVALKIEVSGDKDIEKILRSFAPKAAKNILRRTVLSMAKGIRDDARRQVLTRTRTLKKATIHKRDRGKRGSIEASVWVKHGRGVKHSAFYWRFVEWGAKQAPGKPFLTPAFERGRQTFKRYFRTIFFAQLAKQIAKGKK